MAENSQEILIGRDGAGRVVARHVQQRSVRRLQVVAPLPLEGRVAAHLQNGSRRAGRHSAAGQTGRLQVERLAVRLRRDGTPSNAAYTKNAAAVRVRRVAHGALHRRRAVQLRVLELVVLLLELKLPLAIPPVVQAGKGQNVKNEQRTADGDGDAQGRRVDCRIAAAGPTATAGRRLTSVGTRRCVGCRGRRRWRVRLASRSDASNFLAGRPLFAHVDVRAVDPGRQGGGRVDTFGRQDAVTLEDVVLAGSLKFRQKLKEDGHPMGPELALHLRLGSCNQFQIGLKSPRVETEKQMTVTCLSRDIFAASGRKDPTRHP